MEVSGIANFLCCCCFAVFIAIVLYKWITRNYDYFVNRQIPHGAPRFPFGTSHDLIRRRVSIFDYIRGWYAKFPDARIVGLFELSHPFYLIRDPALARELCIRQFESFADNKAVVDEKIDPLMGNTLMALRGKQWKSMRSTLSAAFTGSRMRLMFDLVRRSVEASMRAVDRDIAASKVLEMKDFFSHFTVDVISSCAFGLEVNSFDDPNNRMQQMAQLLMNQRSVARIFKFIGIKLCPKLMTILGIKILPKSVERFFKSTIVDTFRRRRLEGITTRVDMIDLLMKIEKGDLVDDNGDKVHSSRAWTENEIISQCLTFYFAGFRTTSTTLSFAVYELALNPEIQDKLRKEISKVNEIAAAAGVVSYDSIHEIKYLDQVVMETLRKWPPAPAVERCCVVDHTVQLADDRTVIIEKGTNVMIPIFAFHRDERHFASAETFDPERDCRHSAAFMPFGLGPRTCLGSRFALMTIKVILVELLRKFEFHVCERTQIPLEFKKGIAIETERGIWLDMRRIR